MLARAIPEFAISPDDAHTLAVAICNYARHTDYRMDPRTRDLGALILTLCMIEGPRIVRASTRRSAAKAAAKAHAEQAAGAGGGMVIDMSTGRPAG